MDQGTVGFDDGQHEAHSKDGAPAPNIQFQVQRAAWKQPTDHMTRHALLHTVPEHPVVSIFDPACPYLPLSPPRQSPLNLYKRQMSNNLYGIPRGMVKNRMVTHAKSALHTPAPASNHHFFRGVIRI
eukprot:CAMPEP_0202897558 /NCGR_PEP_ID=MMETSP1392-20130828/6292_1 /ASSEMBLY_ACC=CAM_ASM_000868 /TAXON_ID=225041 /ORGANISM="Chlamydomonas chlamydogama, Strain SAG 11-48b" /LENGTH=126 /DNA_ID=CAMNT_0049583235 /DNA_START=488 /DNA_END=868 /DNA_ORIENTATION=+